MPEINGFTLLEDGTYQRESDGQTFPNLREVYDTVSSLWAIAKQYTEQRKERLMIVKLNAKEQEQAYLEEMFPEMETFKRMEQLEKEYDMTLRQIVLLNTGEKFPGTSTRTTKEVEINDVAAVRWAIETQHFEWLTLRPNITKMLQEAVKKRLFEVPADVAFYFEKKGAIISDTKLLNGDGKSNGIE